MLALGAQPTVPQLFVTVLACCMCSSQPTDHDVTGAMTGIAS